MQIQQTIINQKENWNIDTINIVIYFFGNMVDHKASKLFHRISNGEYKLYDETILTILRISLLILIKLETQIPIIEDEKIDIVCIVAIINYLPQTITLNHIKTLMNYFSSI